MTKAICLSHNNFKTLETSINHTLEKYEKEGYKLKTIKHSCAGGEFSIFEYTAIIIFEK